jgi:putative OPT family oligopeptide transporter
MTGPNDRRSVAEFTFKAVACGLAFGALFGAANAYLGLKAGLTVSTSIPIAVLSVAVFRMLGRRGGTILEANMAQTIGSASSSLASGTIFTIPALFIWGFSPPLVQVALLAFFGGVLGILAMIPLRRLLIVQADAELPYPEGRACAEVLRASEKGASGGTWILVGLGVGAGLKLVISGFHLIPEEVVAPLPALPNGSLSIAIAPALLAVGYIIGFRAAAVMVSGSLISALVLIPLITKAHGSAITAGSGVVPLTAGAIRGAYMRYVGAGAIAAAAFVTIVRTAPTMLRSFRAVVAGLRRGGAEAGAEERTDRDLPAAVLVAGLLALVVALAIVPGLFAGNLPLGGRIVAALGVTVFGFLFVPVSSRLVGVIGVSSNPTSAMALITLAATAGVFAALNWGGPDAKAAVLTVGTIVCVAASKAGDISQDLKTGWLVGATPARQQFGQLLAAAVACWAVAGVVVALGSHGEFEEGRLAAPQAKLMKTIIEAVLGEKLPWDLLLAGGSLSLAGVLVGLPGLSFALGIYLPLATMAAVFAGGVVRGVAGRRAGPAATFERGILCASGFVAGEGLAGVLIAGYTFWLQLANPDAPKPVPAPLIANPGLQGAAGIVILFGCAYALWRATRPVASSESR